MVFIELHDNLKAPRLQKVFVTRGLRTVSRGRNGIGREFVGRTKCCQLFRCRKGALMGVRRVVFLAQRSQRGGILEESLWIGEEDAQLLMLGCRVRRGEHRSTTSA